MTSSTIIALCHQTLTDGRPCRGAALRNQPFCRFHQPRAQPQPLPPDLNDQPTTQALIFEVLHRIATRQISNRRAGQLLNALSIAVAQQNSKPLAVPKSKSQP